MLNENNDLPAEHVPLRTARKAFTRHHISSAAREMFFAEGIAAPTMEQIAQAAGIRRSTLYTHFRDKEEILGAIADDYTVGLRTVVAKLPGPKPSQEELTAWIDGFAQFARAERAPTELLVTASGMPQIPAPLRKFGQDFVEMLAEHLPAFRRAIDPEAGLAHAWAMATLRELGWALCFYAQHGDTPEAGHRLAVATILFTRFVHDDC